MDLTKAGMSTLELAIRNIVAGKCVRVDLGHDTIVYKVPSNNPKKYTIRVDIKVTEELNPGEEITAGSIRQSLETRAAVGKTPVRKK